MKRHINMDTSEGRVTPDKAPVTLPLGSHLSCPPTSKEHCIQMWLNFVRHLEGITHSHAIKSHPNDGGLPKDMQNMIRSLVNMSIGPVAARIISMNQTEVVCGGFEQLDVSTKFKHRSIHRNVSLKFYGLNAPEGWFAQSVSSTRKENALVASFVHSPVGENVDWRLSATISLCHAMVLVENYDRSLEFVQRSKVLAPPTRKMQWQDGRVKYWYLSVHPSRSVPLGGVQKGIFYAWPPFWHSPSKPRATF